MAETVKILVERFGKAMVTAGILLCFANIFVWQRLLIEKNHFEIDFLNVGQGDSALVRLVGGATILIDAGPATDAGLRELDHEIGTTRRTIDLVVLSHPEIDHYGGLFQILGRYKIGAIAWNGRTSDSDSHGFGELRLKTNELGIPWIPLVADDVIRYGNNRATILSPGEGGATEKSGNEGGVVLLLDAEGIKTLFAADIGEKTERKLARGIGKVDVLKVAHHGSKYSSSLDFLSAIEPFLAIVEVGKNSYGHPTKEALGNLEKIGAKVFRTDQGGLVRLQIKNGRIEVFRDL